MAVFPYGSHAPLGHIGGPGNFQKCARNIIGNGQNDLETSSAYQMAFPDLEMPYGTADDISYPFRRFQMFRVVGRSQSRGFLQLSVKQTAIKI